MEVRKGGAISRAEYTARHGRGAAKILKRQSIHKNITNDFVANWLAFRFRHCEYYVASEAKHGEPQVYIDLLLL